MHVAASDAEDHAWFVAKAAVRADFPAEGQSDTRPWVSLMPCEQSGLDNAQNLFTGRDWTGGPKDKFKSVLNLIVIIIQYCIMYNYIIQVMYNYITNYITPPPSHHSWEPPFPRVTGRMSWGQRTSWCTSRGSCCADRAGAPPRR